MALCAKSVVSKDFAKVFLDAKVFVQQSSQPTDNK